MEISELRFDGMLRGFLREAREALARHLTTTEAGRLPSQYESAVYKTFEHFAQNHLRALYQGLERDNRAAALLSYSSLLRKPDRRLTDLRPVSLTADSEHLAAHVGGVLDTTWKRVAQRPQYLALHRLAQCPIKYGDTISVRIPVYMNACQAQPQWLSVPPDEFALRGPFLFNKTHTEPLAALYSACDSAEGSIAPSLQEFVERLAATQEEGGDRYPGPAFPQEEYRVYAEYLTELLGWNDRGSSCPLHLCTIAISDDLSNIPLGTAMIFSEKAIHPEAATEIHDLCFEVFDGFYKLESELYYRQQTALLVANWVNHEAKNWASDIGVIADRLFALEDIPQDLPNDLVALSKTVPITTELLRQMHLSAGGISIRYFRSNVRYMSRCLLKQATVSLDTDAVSPTRDVPRGLLLITMELLRNVVKHGRRAPADMDVCVSLSEDQGSLILSVKSWPHRGDIEAITTLDQLNRELVPALMFQPTLNRKIGAAIVKQLVAALGGAVTWRWDPLDTGEEATVTATCRIPCG